MIPQTDTIVVTGTNDAPTIVDGTIASQTIQVAPITDKGLPFTEIAASYLTAGPDPVTVPPSAPGDTNGFGNHVLPANDDLSTSAIDLTPVFNNNGSISFTGPTATYTPSSFTGSTGNPIIAPFWADVGTRGGSTSAGSNGHSDGANLVFYDIVFRYENIKWTTGDASGGRFGLGGIHARAGFDDGQGHFLELPQSGTAAMLNLPSVPGNTGTPGVYIFQSDGGAIVPTQLTASGVINFTDPDLTDAHSAATPTFLGSGQPLGTFFLVENSDTTGTGTGGQFAWTYTVDPHDGRRPRAG